MGDAGYVFLVYLSFLQHLAKRGVAVGENVEATSAGAVEDEIGDEVSRREAGLEDFA